MYRAMIIAGDEPVRRKVHGYLSELGLIEDILELDHSPGDMELTRLLRMKPPHLVLYGVTSLSVTQEFLKNLGECLPGTTVIALSQVTDQRTVRELMRMGIKGFIPVPILRPVFVETVRQAIDQVSVSPGAGIISQLYSFLPGKGGSGTSTLACHFAQALSVELAPGIRQGKLRRVLLMDLDMTSGSSKSFFGANASFTLGELIESGVPLDATYWPRFVTRSGELDVIIGGRTNPRRPLLAAHVRPMLEYAKDNYSAILVDLTGNWEAFALDVLRQSAGIFLVVQTDLLSMRLAQERLQLLERFDLAKRTMVLVNRFADRLPLSSGKIAEEVGAPVFAEFEFDDKRVQDALANGKLVNPDSSVGKQLHRAAKRLCWDPIQREMAQW
jgi:pilus assembly protein CpaE